MKLVFQLWTKFLRNPFFWGFPGGGTYFGIACDSFGLSWLIFGETSRFSLQPYKSTNPCTYIYIYTVYININDHHRTTSYPVCGHTSFLRALPSSFGQARSSAPALFEFGAAKFGPKVGQSVLKGCGTPHKMQGIQQCHVPWHHHIFAVQDSSLYSSGLWAFWSPMAVKRTGWSVSFPVPKSLWFFSR